MRIFRLLGFVFFLSAIACTSIKSPIDASSRFTADEIAVYELADRGERYLIPILLDSLEGIGMLSENLTILALRLSASPGDSSTLKYITGALNDPKPLVRNTAVWATGTIGIESSCVLLLSYLETERNQQVRASLWEALGKCLPAEKSSLLSKAPEGLTETEGWLKGWYALVVKDRELPLPESLVQLNPSDSSAAFWYWQILARSRFDFPGFDEKSITDPLRQLIVGGSELPTAIAAAAWRVQDASALKSLATISMDTLLPPPLRAALVRSITPKRAYNLHQLRTLLEDPHYQVRKALAQLLKEAENIADFSNLESTCPETLALLLEATYRQSKHSGVISRMLDSIYYSENPYTRSFFASSIPYYPGYAETIFSLLDTINAPLLLSSLSGNAISQLDSMTDREKQTVVRAILRKKDTGSIAAMCEILRTGKFPYSMPPDSLLTSRQLEQFRKTLLLPKETECHNAISSLLREKYGLACPDYKPVWNRPIDWALLNALSDTKAIIYTSEGEFVLELNPKDAPGSVADFIRLSRAGYYSGKYIHRAVPNFVAQGGCPRGDGWGSLDYSLRTEISMRLFGAGSVGLASAGTNTENCQWFITHSPTPHLNGRYTIFAQVISGMETVHRLKVGSRINRVELRE
jgi:cyclophilin family peptidyl-prolyl cis-trans isomerase